MDAFFRFVTNYKNFLPVLIPFLVWLLWKGGAKGRWFVLALGVGILLSDQTASHLLKDWVGRVRPCNALEGIRTPDGPRGSYSFPSSHGANMGAAFVLLALAFGSRALWFLPLALASGLSRVYLGLHYPSDVAAGYLWGGLVGWAVWRSLERVRARLGRNNAGVPPGRKGPPKKKGRRKHA